MISKVENIVYNDIMNDRITDCESCKGCCSRNS